MKSLDKLRKSTLFVRGNGGCYHDGATFGYIADKLADEIQAEIDRYYLPRPLVEDGEPVQLDDFVIVPGQELPVQASGVEYKFDDGSMTLIGAYGCRIRIPDGVKLKRPPEPDTQEKIDEDAALYPSVYVCRHKLTDKVISTSNTELTRLMIDHLLERQRKVCEAKS